MQRKAFPFVLKKANDSGEFSGYASTFGNVDSDKDAVMPGAFAKTLPAFLARGFLTDGHDWTDPIAFPTEAYEDSRGLFIAGSFHSTTRAQRLRTIARERLAAGKQMGLSIGYKPEDFRHRKDGVRELLRVELLEVALTLTPVNTAALVTQVKGHAFQADPSLVAMREHFYLQAGGRDAFAANPALLELRRSYLKSLPPVIAALKAS